MKVKYIEFYFILQLIMSIQQNRSCINFILYKFYIENKMYLLTLKISEKV